MSLITTASDGSQHKADQARPNTCPHEAMHDLRQADECL